MVPNCSPGHDASIVSCDLPRSKFEVDLSRTLCTMIFVIWYDICDLCWSQYWPDPKSYLQKCMSFKKLSNIVCRLSLRFVAFEIWRRAEKAPARFRAFQSPPGIGLSTWTSRFHTDEWWIKHSSRWLLVSMSITRPLTRQQTSIRSRNSRERCMQEAYQFAR